MVGANPGLQYKKQDLLALLGPEPKLGLQVGAMKVGGETRFRHKLRKLLKRITSPDALVDISGIDEKTCDHFGETTKLIATLYPQREVANEQGHVIRWPRPSQGEDFRRIRPSLSIANRFIMDFLDPDALHKQQLLLQPRDGSSPKPNDAPMVSVSETGLSFSCKNDDIKETVIKWLAGYGFHSFVEGRTVTIPYTHVRAFMSAMFTPEILGTETIDFLIDQMLGHKFGFFDATKTIPRKTLAMRESEERQRAKVVSDAKTSLFKKPDGSYHKQCPDSPQYTAYFDLMLRLSHLFGITRKPGDMPSIDFQEYVDDTVTIFVEHGQEIDIARQLLELGIDIKFSSEMPVSYKEQKCRRVVLSSAEFYRLAGLMQMNAGSVLAALSITEETKLRGKNTDSEQPAFYRANQDARLPLAYEPTQEIAMRMAYLLGVDANKENLRTETSYDFISNVRFSVDYPTKGNFLKKLLKAEADFTVAYNAGGSSRTMVTVTRESMNRLFPFALQPLATASAPVQQHGAAFAPSAPPPPVVHPGASKAAPHQWAGGSPAFRGDAYPNLDSFSGQYSGQRRGGAAMTPPGRPGAYAPLQPEHSQWGDYGYGHSPAGFGYQDEVERDGGAAMGHGRGDQAVRGLDAWQRP